MSRIVGSSRLPDGGHLLQIHHDAAGEVRPGHWFRLRLGDRDVALAVLDASCHEGWLGFRVPKAAEPPPAYGTTCDLDGPFGDTLTPASAGRDMVLVTDAQGLSAALFAATAGAENDTAPRLVLAELRATPPVRLRPSRFMLPGLPPGTIAGVSPLEDAGIPSRVAHPDGLPGCHDGNMAELLRHWIKHQRAAQRWRYAVTVIGADRFVSELETLLAGHVGEHRGMVIPPG